MNERDSLYRAFLLRCWRDGGEWRFSLEATGPTRKRHGFTTFEQLVTFLERELSDDSAPTRKEDT